VLLFRNGNIFFFGDESMLRDISVFLFPRGPRISLRINPLNSSLALNQLCAFAAAALFKKRYSFSFGAEKHLKAN